MGRGADLSTRSTTGDNRPRPLCGSGTVPHIAAMLTEKRNAWYRRFRLLAVVVVLGLLLAPGLAEARAGMGGSFGSRGSMTWSAPPATGTAPYSARPFQRSGASYGYNGYGMGYGRHSPFMSGLLGGLLGAGIGGLLFGHGFWGAGMGFGGFFGLLLQILLLVWAVRFLLRMFRGGRPVLAGGPTMFGRGTGPIPMSATGGPSASLTVGPGDYRAFENSLYAIQSAWSAHDLNALRALATPEMASYFARQLADQASGGVRNEVRDVRLLQGDLAQAWSEGRRDYATVAMRFGMVDVTYDAAGRIVDGSPTEHVTATELWTFLRDSAAGQWILSAIQQAR
jgi:predicted lipid-binding transport protein (Tim44 family)